MYRELGKILFKTFIIKIKNMENEAGYSFMSDMFSFFFLNFCCSNCDNNRNLTVNHNELVRAHQLIGYLTDMATSMLMSLYTLISWLDVLTDMTTQGRIQKFWKAGAQNLGSQITVFPSWPLWNAIECWFLQRLVLGIRSSVGTLALPLRPLYSNISLLSFLLFLRDSHFLLSKNASHTPSFITVITCHKSGSALLHAF